MRIIILVICALFFANGAVIMGNQDKVTTMSGTIDIESGGVTKTVKPGEVSFTKEGAAPTDARRVQKGDIEDVLSDTDVDRKIDLPIGKFTKEEAKEVYKTLVLYFDRDKIYVVQRKDEIEINIVNEYYSKVNAVFPKIKHLIKIPKK